MATTVSLSLLAFTQYIIALECSRSFLFLFLNASRSLFNIHTTTLSVSYISFVLDLVTTSSTFVLDASALRQPHIFPLVHPTCFLRYHLPSNYTVLFWPPSGLFYHPSMKLVLYFLPHCFRLNILLRYRVLVRTNSVILTFLTAGVADAMSSSAAIFSFSG